MLGFFVLKVYAIKPLNTLCGESESSSLSYMRRSDPLRRLEHDLTITR